MAAGEYLRRSRPWRDHRHCFDRRGQLSTGPALLRIPQFIGMAIEVIIDSVVPIEAHFINTAVGHAVIVVIIIADIADPVAVQVNLGWIIQTDTDITLLPCSISIRVDRLSFGIVGQARLSEASPVNVVKTNIWVNALIIVSVWICPDTTEVHVADLHPHLALGDSLVSIHLQP